MEVSKRNVLKGLILELTSLCGGLQEGVTAQELVVLRIHHKALTSAMIEVVDTKTDGEGMIEM